MCRVLVRNMWTVTKTSINDKLDKPLNFLAISIVSSMKVDTVAAGWQSINMDAIYFQNIISGAI